MEALVLCYRGEPLREFPLRDRPVDVGRAKECDIVVHDPAIAERELVVSRRRGSVRVYSVHGRGRKRDEALAVGAPCPVGRNHSLVLVSEQGAELERDEPRTDPVTRVRSYCESLSLMVGRGLEARRTRLDGRPVTIGSDPGNDLVLADRTVSASHCRVDPYGDLAWVRDLGSRNGTWVDGVRVRAAQVGAGARIRLGRTDLSIVPRGKTRDARSDGLVAVSSVMLQVLSEVERLAQVAWPVLVAGETGVGKEGVARALHTRGPRAGRPFVALNAGGLPRHLVESELFGHERGAFTGAVKQRRGVFEQADTGTLFIDEIGELPLELQSRLLRILDDWMVTRVGGETSRCVDVRLVCATNRDLRAMAASGLFRMDLYYRIARLVIEVPPLRERLDCIPALASHFLDQVRPEIGQRRLASSAIELLTTHPWPGNVRELRNIVAAAAAASPSELVQVQDVNDALARLSGSSAWEPTEESLRAVLERHDGNLSAAARALGLARSTLRDRIKGRLPTRTAALDPGEPPPGLESVNE